MQFDDEVVGGITLVRPAIQSPDYAVGASGWSINADGSAEFNNVAIRGGETIGSDFLIYSGTPAAGTLILSISGAGGTDPYGNTYGPGVMSYGSRLGLDYIASIVSGEIFLSRPDMANPAVISYNDLTNGQYELFISSGQGDTTGVRSFVSIVSSSTDDGTDGEISLHAPKISTSGALEVAATAGIKVAGRQVPVPQQAIAPAYSAWTGPSNTNYQTLRLISDGTRVYLDGAASTKTAFTGSQVAFTIPSGLMPKADQYFGTVRATSGDPRTVGCQVLHTGAVNILASTTVATTDTWSFSEISWSLA